MSSSANAKKGGTTGAQVISHPTRSLPKKKSEAGAGYWLWTAIGIVAAWIARDSKWYAPGSSFGYYLGVVGGSSMLLLLLYPLRKRIRLLHRLLPLKHWFRAHMFLGVFGPVLIIFHSKLHLGSTNAAIAFYCMLTVFLSGLVGRFVYVKIHYGLYGRRSSRTELKQQLGINMQEMRSRLHFARDAETMLTEFEAAALAPRSPWVAARRFMFLPLHKRWVQLRAVSAFDRALWPEAKKRKWDRARLRRAQQQGRMIIAAYLKAVQTEAQFTVYERLFSLWHVLHVPLVFLLVITGVVHVIAVHMY